MCSGRPDMLENLQLSTNPKDYFWVSQGVTKVEGMDDEEEFKLTDVSNEELIWKFDKNLNRNVTRL